MELRIRYDQQSNEVIRKIERLKKIIKQHKKHFEKEPCNWGYLGDLINLENRLDDILHFTKCT